MPNNGMMPLANSLPGDNFPLAYKECRILFDCPFFLRGSFWNSMENRLVLFLFWQDVKIAHINRRRCSNRRQENIGRPIQVPYPLGPRLVSAQYSQKAIIKTFWQWFLAY